MVEERAADAWRAILRGALTAAMKTRDTTAVRALRSAMSAIDNAEAPDTSHAPAAQAGRISHGVRGLGAGEVARRELSADEVLAIIEREIAERRASAEEYARLGQREASDRLLVEAAALQAVLS